jgi:Microtubule-binding calmodulin-regulated spectrin-associated
LFLLSNLLISLFLLKVFKIYGTGPKQITDNMMEQYYKYNSGNCIFFVFVV